MPLCSLPIICTLFWPYMWLYTGVWVWWTKTLTSDIPLDLEHNGNCSSRLVACKTWKYCTVISYNHQHRVNSKQWWHTHSLSVKKNSPRSNWQPPLEQQKTYYINVFTGCTCSTCWSSPFTNLLKFTKDFIKMCPWQRGEPKNNKRPCYDFIVMDEKLNDKEVGQRSETSPQINTRSSSQDSLHECVCVM